MMIDKIKALGCPPGFRVNVFAIHQDTYLLQFERVSENTHIVMNVHPQMFDTLCVTEPKIIIMFKSPEEIYVSDYTDNVAIEAFINKVKDLIENNDIGQS